MKQEKISDIDKKLCLYFIFQNPIAFRDFFVPQAFHKPFYTYYYQYPQALMEEVVWAGARSTGKSLDMEFKLCERPFKYPAEEQLVTAYRRTHIKDRLEKVISFFASIPYLRRFLYGDTSKSLKSAVTRTPIYSIRFKNGAEISGISCGDDAQAVMMLGKHPCLHPQQRVLLEDKRGLSIRKIIGKLRRGKKIYVKSYDEKEKKIVIKEALNGWYTSLKKKKIFRIYLEDNSNSLLTNDHKCYVESGNTKGYVLKRVDKLKVNEDKILTSEKKLSEAQISLIIGGLLGDSSGRKSWIRKLGKKKLKKCRDTHSYILFGHKLDHYDYVKFKFDVLRDFIYQKSVKIRTRTMHGMYNGICKTAKFQTGSFFQFDQLTKLFYKSGKKTITKKILDLIDEKALAIWFMDDGSCHRKKDGKMIALNLCTEGYSKGENLLMKNWFFQKYNIKVNLERRRRRRIFEKKKKIPKFHYLLRFSRNEALKFIPLVLPYIHPVFRYKVDDKKIDLGLLGSKLNDFFKKDEALLGKMVTRLIEDNPRSSKTVCDLQIKDTHNFFAGDMLVSNCIRYIEEAGVYPIDAYLKWQNTQAPQGSIDCFYGIPNGRLDTPFFEITHKLKRFKNKRFRIHRAMEPNWTQELKQEKIAAFKSITSNDYLQEIEAQDGIPAYGYWSEADIRKNIDFTESTEYPGVIAKQLLTIAISAKDYEGLDPAQVLNRLPQIPDDCEVILGIDAGYSQPTVILPFYFYQKKWNLQCKIMLTDRMISDDQTELIDYIASFYHAYLGIDTSSADGRDIASALCNPKNEEYANEQYDKRVFFIDFRAVVITGYKKIQKGSDPENIEIEEIKEDLKTLTSKLLRDKFYNVEFNLLYDEDFIPEFLSETQKRIAHHEFTIYTPANVHIPEACRVFAGAWWFLHVKIEKPPLEEIEDEEYNFQYPQYQDPGFNLFGRGKPEKDESLM